MLPLTVLKKNGACTRRAAPLPDANMKRRRWDEEFEHMQRHTRAMHQMTLDEKLQLVRQMLVAPRPVRTKEATLPNVRAAERVARPAQTPAPPDTVLRASEIFADLIGRLQEMSREIGRSRVSLATWRHELSTESDDLHRVRLCIVSGEGARSSARRVDAVADGWDAMARDARRHDERLEQSAKQVDDALRDAVGRFEVFVRVVRSRFPASDLARRYRQFFSA